MLKPTRLINSTATERLVKVWAKRYEPNLSAFPTQDNNLNIYQLIEAASCEGRGSTVAKLKQHLKTECELAAIQTNTLFSYIANVVNLAEARRLNQFVGQVYLKVLEIYQQQLPTPALRAARSIVVDFSSNVFVQWVMPALELPEIEQLAIALEPMLLQLQTQHLAAKDRRALGFITTQFHFSTKLVLQELTIPEQVSLQPYFNFIEEQVCIPWQRICAAAARHPLGSPTLAVVQQLLPQSQEIAQTVYSQALERYPAYRSRRGTLSNPSIRISTVRDLNMFQAYLFLCMLEESMAAVEQELVSLCEMVFPTIHVTWVLVRQVLQLLVNELLKRLEPGQRHLLLPYTQAMQQIFSKLETALPT